MVIRYSIMTLTYTCTPNSFVDSHCVDISRVMQDLLEHQEKAERK